MAGRESRYVLEVIRQDLFDPMLVAEMAARQGRAERMAERVGLACGYVRESDEDGDYTLLVIYTTDYEALSGLAAELGLEGEIELRSAREATEDGEGPP